MDFDESVDKYDIPAFLRRNDVSLDLSSPVPAEGDIVKKALAKLRTPTRSEKLRAFEAAPVDDASPSGFTAALSMYLLSGARTPALPTTLGELNRWRLDRGILADLERLVRDGHAEAEVVAAFLYALAESPLGQLLDRHARRVILKGWKHVAPGHALDATLRAAIREADSTNWNWHSPLLSLETQP